MGQLLRISANSGLTLKKGGDPVPVRHVVRYMYANGYDLRHFATTKISPAVAEIILSAYHGVRACADGSEPGEPAVPERLKRAQMLALTHGLLASNRLLQAILQQPIQDFQRSMEITIFESVATLVQQAQCLLRHRPHFGGHLIRCSRWKCQASAGSLLNCSNAIWYIRRALGSTPLSSATMSSAIPRSSGR